MNKRQPTKPLRQPARPDADPAHAPGKHHIARETGSAGVHAIERQQQRQRMPGGAASVHNHRTDRGR
ncbi:MAG: hypothetical protein Q7V88_03675 [Actinomycetota bacterium]|nr:hypothetical protein [Actinomycetota bacterium]